MSAPYTADQLEEGIVNALKAHDVKAAVAILEVLASVDVERAADVLDVMQIGGALARRASENKEPGK